MSVLQECKRQILSAPDQSEVLIGIAELPRASAYIKINRQALSYTSLPRPLRIENRQEMIQSETEMAAVTLTLTEAVT